MQSGVSPSRFLPVFEARSRSLEFRPFLDRFSVLTRVLLSIFIGASFVWIQYWSLDSKERTHYWWLLGAMISCATLFFCYATAVFRAALWEMYAKTDSPEQTVYFQEVLTELSDRRFLQAAIFFGCLNAVMGILFGVPYSGILAKMVAVFGFFVVGFACGMPAQGIYGVVKVVDAFAGEEKLRLDYTDPDGCGGLRFLGTALVRFSSITLIMGVLIAWYILHTSWTHTNSPLVQGVFAFWIAFPFLLSLLVLFVPASAISRRLKAFKLENSKTLQSRIDSLRNEFENSSHDARRHEILEKIYDYHVKLRMELYAMRTWPYNLNSGVKYSSVFLVNAGAALVNANDQWEFFLKVWQKIRH